MRSTPTDTDTDTSLSTALINVGEPAPSVEGAPSFQPIPVATGSVPADQTSPGPPHACTASAITSDVAIAVLTEGLGTLAGARKAEQALEAADHVRDAERATAATGRRIEPAFDQAEQAIPSRRAAFQSAKDRAGVARSQSPERQWTVGRDAARAGRSNYRLSDDAGSNGRYYEYETANGTRVVVEHTSDSRAPSAHFHAGQPKGDPARANVDFQTERYQQVDGKHHIYYKK